MGNVGIYSVGAESVYQTVQSDRIECLVGVSWKGLTCGCLAGSPYPRDTREAQLFPSILTLRIPVMCRAHAYFCGMLSREIPTKTLLVSVA